MRTFSVVDLFSGVGGMSFGFVQHPAFRVRAAADAQVGKPSAGSGRLQCNGTYCRNIGVEPAELDLSCVAAPQLRESLGLDPACTIDVLLACPPCTGFSRANPRNHLRDDRRNSLVRKTAEFAVALDSTLVLVENARELISGNFRAHFEWFTEYLEQRGYSVSGRSYVLTTFGLPQARERAIVVAVKNHLTLRTLDSLWAGWTIRRDAVTVRRAFATLNGHANGAAICPSFASPAVARRIRAVPHDGGSWTDLLRRPDSDSLLTEAMKRNVKMGRLGSYPDVYGRMAWDKPAPTIKRECAHVGNGRYAHPTEDRLCSAREMAALQGFPSGFVFGAHAVSNVYRHIGDAVPPLVSYQLAHLAHWILTGCRPKTRDLVLAGTNLQPSDVVRSGSARVADDA